MLNKAVFIILSSFIFLSCGARLSEGIIKQQRVFKRTEDKVFYSSDAMKVYSSTLEDSISLQFYSVLTKVHKDTFIYVNPLKKNNNDHVTISFFMSVIHDDPMKNSVIRELTFAIDRSFIWKADKFGELEKLTVFVVNERFLMKSFIAETIDVFIEGPGYLNKMSFDKKNIDDLRFFYDVTKIHLPKSL